MYATGTIQILEGVVGSLMGPGRVPEAQAMTNWLRAMKDNINYMGKNIENAFVIDVNAAVTATETTIQAAATYMLGYCAASQNLVATVVELWDVATPTPGTTATGQHGALQLPIGSATAVAVGGVVWFPYEYFGTTCLVSAVAHSDYATAAAATVNVWTVRRDE